MNDDFPARVREPAVAGTFYPAQPGRLERLLDGYIAQARRQVTAFPKALIAPHAGCIYSGPVAGSAFVHWRDKSALIKRVVLLGPSHHVPFDGLALSRAAAWDTPLGRVPVDMAGQEQAASLKGVAYYEAPHEPEHALELELIFLQRILADFKVVPLLVGCETPPARVSEMISRLWGGKETAIVISSDLSHYNDYAAARRLDQATAEAIEALEPGRVTPEQACGWLAIQGLLEVAASKKMEAQTADLRNSGDTAGPRDRVVGYGAFTFVERA